MSSCNMPLLTSRDTQSGSSFGEALRSLTSGLQQLSALSSTLTDQYEHSAATAKTRALSSNVADQSENGISTVAKTQSGCSRRVKQKQLCVHKSSIGVPPEIQVPARLPAMSDTEICEAFKRPVVQKVKKPFRDSNVNDEALMDTQDSVSKVLMKKSKSSCVHFKEETDEGLVPTKGNDRMRDTLHSDYDTDINLDDTVVFQKSTRKESSPGRLGSTLSQSKFAELRPEWSPHARHIDIEEIEGVFKLTVTHALNFGLLKSVDSEKGKKMNIGAVTPDLVDASRAPASSRRLSQSDDYPFCLMHPLGRAKLIWTFITTLVIAWDIFFIPLDVFTMPDWYFFSAMEWLIAIFWTCDIFVTFRTGFMQGHKVEMRPARIAVRYLRTWFVLDLCIVACEWLIRFITTLVSGGILLRISRVVRAFRSVRLLRVAKLQHVINMIEDQVNSAAIQMFFVLLKMTLGLIFVVHFVTCFWYLLGDSSDGWVEYPDIPPCASQPGDGTVERNKGTLYNVALWYTYSARWVLAQANGRIDQDARRNITEMAFTCIVAVMGPMLCMSVFISSITATMFELNAMAQTKRVNRLRLNRYLADNTVSPVLCARMKAYIRSQKNVDKDLEAEQFVLSIMPKQLQKELMYEIRAPTVIEHRLFDGINEKWPQVIRHITMHALKSVLVHDEEVVFEVGDACRRMLFAYRGHFVYSEESETFAYARAKNLFELAAEEGMVATRSNTSGPRVSRQNSSDGSWQDEAVGKGVWISEGAVWLEWQNQGTLTAVSDGCFFCLEVETFFTVAQHYSDVLTRLVAYAVEFERTVKDHGKLSDIMDIVVIRLLPEDEMDMTKSMSVNLGPHGEPKGKRTMSETLAWLRRNSQ